MHALVLVTGRRTPPVQSLPAMGVFAFLVVAICNPFRRLVGRLLGIRDVQAQERLHLELYSLTSRNNNLTQQNEALRRNLFGLERLCEVLEVKVKKIQQQLCSELEGGGSYVDGSATPCLLESTLKNLHLKISCFAKLFVDLMNSYGVDHRQALETHFKGTYLTRSAHVSFMLKAWIYSVLFENFENESFLPGGVTLFLDHNQRKLKFFEYFQRISVLESSLDYTKLDYASKTFYHRKLFCFLALWQSLFASQGQKRIGTLFNTNYSFSLANVEAFEPRTRKLIQGFVSAANVVWATHKLCLSFEPCARIFRVGRGAEFKEDHMISVVSKDEDSRFVSEVGFMISPGFCVRKSVVKCEIYLRGA